MPLSCMNLDTSVTSALLTHLPAHDVVYLLDVGASGGIEEHWPLHFREVLLAEGFDPLISEVERLNQEAPRNIRYWNAFIDGGAGLRNIPAPHPEDVRLTAFDRTTASEFGRLKSQDYRQQVFNRGEPLEFSTEQFSLDEFLGIRLGATPNFIKVDTDGSDYPVIQGAEQALNDLRCFGVQIECQFHGRPGSESSTFANIDDFLRRRGLRIFHLETWNYSRLDLPSRFLYDIPAQTVSGGLQWGEALYFRDPVTNEDFRRLLRESPSVLVKYLAVVIMFGQFDLAASAIQEVRSSLEPGVDALMTSTLDALTAQIDPNVSSHKEYREKFCAYPEGFMPRSQHGSGTSNRSIQANRLKSLARRIKSMLSDT